MAYHVYVIELNPQTFIPNKKFRKQNPHIFDSKGKKTQDEFKIFYVGQSAHSPKCRFEQHKTCHGDNIEFTCFCGMKCACHDDAHVIKKNMSNKFVRDHGIKLRRDLFVKYNPISSYDESVKTEKYLAAELRKLGHASYCN